MVAGPTEDRDIPGLLGLRVGHYRLTRELGRGGMGVVCLAVHERIGQRAAVKVLLPGWNSNARYLRRFVREARAASRVHHPGLVKIFDFGQTPDGAPYLLMELLEGECLRARLLRAREAGAQGLPVDDALRITRQLALALAALHEAGIVHRDLKPENVMLLPDPEVDGGARAKLLDFGIARLTQEAPDASMEGRAVGTLCYMSPEQWVGEDDIDGKADVYALGVMLHELLSGAPPFDGDRRELGLRHMAAEPAPLRQRVGVPAEVERLVLQMLRKEPSLRPGMDEVAAALRERATPVRTPASPSVEGASRRGPLLRAPALALLAAGLAAAILCWRWAKGGGDPARILRRGPQGMVRIEGGAFVMGSTPQEITAAFEWSRRSGCPRCPRELYEREQPVRQVELSPYLLDRTEVTNARFAAWLGQRRGLTVREEEKGGAEVWEGETLLINLFPRYEAGGIRHEAGRFTVQQGLEDHPVTQVSWDGALRYCQAQGLRLPTEAEWELAARSRAGQRFPWGDTAPSCDGVIFGRVTGQACAGSGYGPAAVCSAPQDRTPQNVCDLAGNVAEWVMDRMRLRYPPCGPRCLDPVVEDNTAEDGGPAVRIMRGGSWFRGAEACRTAGRSKRKQDAVMGDLGFRCAGPAPR